MEDTTMIIQIIEDDKALSKGITMALQENDITFVQSQTLASAKNDFLSASFSLLILDLSLPDGSGYDYLQWVRKRSDVPVLILTANDLELDEVMGLNLGADDFMTKPFSLAVLRARINALLRRQQKSSSSLYIEDNFTFDFDHLQFKRKDEPIFLSPTEQKLLRIFLEHKEQLLTREILIDRLWSDGGEFVDANALSVTINRLRGKLENHNESHSYIQTIYGQGYMWKKKEIPCLKTEP